MLEYPLLLSKFYFLLIEIIVACISFVYAMLFRFLKGQHTCILIFAKIYMILKIELIIFKIINGNLYCIVIYIDLVKSYGI